MLALFTIEIGVIPTWATLTLMRFCPATVKDYLNTELPVFFELRVRYLQACERLQEAKALAKVCLENCEAGNHLYFHQAYLTCLYKASLHEHLHKEVGGSLEQTWKV